ncbi:unnamed protein product [Sphagnum troendelagicum]
MPDVTGSFAKPEEESSFEKELDSSKGDDKSAVSSNGVSERSESATPHWRKVCILSIDGGGMRGIIPGRALAYLEEALQKNNNPAAQIADYFDIAAGTSVSGLPGKALKEIDDGQKSNVKMLVKLAEEMLASSCMEHLPYGGRVEVLDRSNKDCLDWFAEQIIQEYQEQGSNTHVHFHDMCI